MEQTQQTKTSPKYWMSLEQWRKDPEFAKLAETEFRSSPLQSADGEDGWARREFLKIMGASLALTSFGCIRRPAQKIIPYAKKPFDVVHGVPNYYASSYVDGVEGFGIVVTTRDGRPIKVEGNTDDPINGGGMSARAHAHIMKLYDPDRYTGAKRNLQNEKRTNREIIGVAWENLDKAVSEQLKKGKIAVLTNTIVSPTTRILLSEFVSSFGAKHYVYDDISYEGLMDGQKTSYGQSVLPRYRIDQARYILAVNCDFLGTWLTPTGFQKQFAKGRKAGAEMNKLVVVEPLLTLTGSNADERHRIRPSQTLDVLMAIMHEIVVAKKQSRYADNSAVISILSAYARDKSEMSVPVAEIANELMKNRGRSLVLAGGLSCETENSQSIQVAVNMLNSILENDGKTVDAGAGSIIAAGHGTEAGMGELLKSLSSGDVNTLIIHGCNPFYSLPVDAKFREALDKIEMVIYTGDRNDETARFADFVATDHHPMENWGDLEAYGGVVSIQQPTIRPLHDTRAFQDSLLSWIKLGGKGSAKAKASGSWYEYLRSHWRDAYFPTHKGSMSFEEFWIDLLQKGVIESSRAAGATRNVVTAAFSQVQSIDRKADFELALYSTVGIGDGQLANVSWLQEFPDPVTKICWDNYANFSPKDAKRLGLREGQYVKLTANGQTVEVPAHIQPGQADNVVGLAVGYGRVGAGKVADGIGVNAFHLVKWKNGARITAGFPTTVEVLSRKQELACTQDHHSMEGRQIVVEETLQDHLKAPGGNVHRHKLTTMWSEHKYPGHKWGMVIDLNSCTGCGSCVIACQSENNIPSVGKTYVLSGREMHWIRIDRYYTGDPDNPGVVNQPLPCMHCDNAPCETVCPVAATTHGEEGTNDMIYNRCVGTRYCSNNCPYKVRRFNWFNYTQLESPKNLALNPEVTQRFRGVMEKCTFCIHRIKFEKYRAKVADRKIKDGDIKTACQQSCPAEAIVFGDLNDAESAVAKQFNQPQSYVLLEELNTKPAVRYQVKVRNADELKGAGPHHKGTEPHHEEGQHV
jgi:molybdopterin-containing oxidoreductase family iron-sulfur binding subunit